MAVPLALASVRAALAARRKARPTISVNAACFFDLMDLLMMASYEPDRARCVVVNSPLVRKFLVALLKINPTSLEPPPNIHGMNIMPTILHTQGDALQGQFD